jgi:hypothetical protein
MPVLMQPAVPPRVGGDQTIVVALTVTPPPEQFATFKLPMTEAIALLEIPNKPIAAKR